MQTSELTAHNELAWLANCYVTGELSASESAAFEARLENDVAACDAVASAMQLNLTIAAAFESQPSVLCPQAAINSSFRRAGVAITALSAVAIVAASVALMVAHRDVPPNGLVQQPKIEFPAKDRAERLVAAWASGEAARNNAAYVEDLFDLQDDADLDPPDWMLAALAAEDLNDQVPGNDVRQN